MASSATQRILPLELIDKAIGSQIWILMRGTKEIVGTLRGFDDYVRILRSNIYIYGSASTKHYDALMMFLRRTISLKSLISLLPCFI